MAEGKRKRNRASPPDGGWGWVIVGCCFMVTVCTRAVTRCISIFFVEFQAQFGADYAATAWIHSLVDCTTMLCAPLGSLLGNRWSCRAAVILGGVLSSCGLLLSSFSTSLELLYFSLGILTGLGFALCYTPAIATVGCYFQQKKALAYGIAMSGSGIGTFVLAPAVQELIELYTWRGALLVLSAMVSNLCVCGALLRPLQLTENGEEGGESAGEDRCGVGSSKDAELGALPSAQRRGLSSYCLSSKEYRFLLLPDFLGLAVSILLLASGCSLPFVYLVPYALSADVSHQQAAFLMSILGIVDIVGNVTFGWLTDRRWLKPYRLACYVFAVAMDGLCCLFTPLLQSFPLLVPFSILYGYFDGAYVALIPVVTSDIVGATYLSSALGVVFFLHAIPYLISPPVGGWLVDVTGTYTATFFLSGVAMLASALVLSTIAGFRRCHRQRSAVTMEAELKPFNKQVLGPAVVS
ncbi:monocarboxylate transporter 12-B [Betta splendens]|uniref:Monocarboxylate transporter 12-B n=1 Tax=Betta splendens TaxID=158456 RepID=A0A6P7L519_BETSP|nr:monocarboxylate transporter 12-B [Betta splendens]XP_028989687.1 monocarboxylate transporter 12-B [Betta splendens]XP_028989689.1 monocarboxylate transporter 12-B [Betta splendens]XP_040924582.1 monocarboxylate transporter 12-B [Betta splendens]